MRAHLCSCAFCRLSPFHFRFTIVCFQTNFFSSVSIFIIDRVLATVTESRPEPSIGRFGMKPSSNLFCKYFLHSDCNSLFIVDFHSLKSGSGPACVPNALQQAGPAALRILYYVDMDFDLSIKASISCSSIIMTLCFIYLLFDPV